MLNMKVLLLNLVPNTIGDSIILLPVFKAVKKKYDYLAVTCDNLSKQLWEDNKEIDELIEVNELSYIGNRKKPKLLKAFVYFFMFLKLVFKLRKYKFDSCIILYPNFFVMPLIPFFSGIKKIYGFTYKGCIFKFLLTKSAKSKIIFDGYLHRHMIYSFKDLLKQANIEMNDFVAVKNIDKKDIEYVKNYLDKNNINRKKVICIHTTSKSIYRNWPKDSYNELISILLKNNFSIFLLGSQNEKNYNDFFVREKVYNLCGVFNIKQTAALISLSTLFIGNDSGLGHLASSVGAKTFIIYGSTDPKHALPLGYGKVYYIFKNKKSKTFGYLKNNPEQDLKAMQEIKPKEVFDKIQKILSL